MEGLFAGGKAAREQPLLFWIPRPRRGGGGVRGGGPQRAGARLGCRQCP